MLRNVVDFNCSVLCTLHCESRITSTATGAVIFGPHGLLFTRIYQLELLADPGQTHRRARLPQRPHRLLDDDRKLSNGFNFL